MSDKATIPVPGAFEAAVHELRHRPPDIGAFWGAWVKHASQKNVRRPMLTTFIEYFPGYIEVHMFGGVAACVSDGYVRAFLPTALLTADPLDLAAVRAWLDGGVGYLADPIPWGKAVTR